MSPFTEELSRSRPCSRNRSLNILLTNHIKRAIDKLYQLVYRRDSFSIPGLPLVMATRLGRAHRCTGDPTYEARLMAALEGLENGSYRTISQAAREQKVL